jgi:CheY-like chemotaxis protein
MPNSMTLLPCPTCSAPIDLQAAEWCQCASKRLSVVCPSCRACFCKVTLFPMRKQWNRALSELLARQVATKERRASEAPPALTVLIVDDDEEIRMMAEYSVQQMGYRTLTAATGEEAVSIVTEARPDIVLADALMPKMDGRQLCKLIKLADASIKVIVMSSLYTSSRYRVEALHAFHADDYLAKPIDFAQLRRLLEKLSRKAA